MPDLRCGAQRDSRQTQRMTVLSVVDLGSLKAVDQGRYWHAEPDRPIDARREDCRCGE
jgi:hypothetical protein